MQNANSKDERKKISSYSRLPAMKDWERKEPALRKSRVLLNSARNNKQPKRGSDSLSGDAPSAADMSCWSASTVTLNWSGDSPM